MVVDVEHYAIAYDWSTCGPFKSAHVVRLRFGAFEKTIKRQILPVYSTRIMSIFKSIASYIISTKIALVSLVFVI